MSLIDPRPISGRKPTRTLMDFDLLQIVDFSDAEPDHCAIGFDDVLYSRRSIRNMEGIPLSNIAVVIRKTFKTQQVGVDDLCGRYRKVMVSAGAIHPIQCIIFYGDYNYYYDDKSDVFFKVNTKKNSVRKKFISICEEILPEARGAWVLLFADTRNTGHLYENHESLIWRDAGAALQTFAMVCTASGVAFCPLGNLGHEGLESVAPNNLHLHAVGVAAIGAYVDI